MRTGSIRAQNGDRTGETDPFGPDCRRGQDRFRRGIKKLRPVVLANPKDIPPNAIRRLDFVEKVAQAICRAEVLTRQRVRYRGHETIDSDLHGPISRYSSKRRGEIVSIVFQRSLGVGLGSITSRGATHR